MALTQMVMAVITNFTTKIIAYIQGSLLATLVNSATDMDIVVIDNRGVNELFLQINNSDAANGLVYTIYGTNTEAVPPDFPTGPWEAVSGATGTLTFGTNVTITVSKQYSWVLVRAHESSGGSTSHIDVYARQK